jgi:hypothetical protein
MHNAPGGPAGAFPQSMRFLRIVSLRFCLFFPACPRPDFPVSEIQNFFPMENVNFCLNCEDNVYS